MANKKIVIHDYSGFSFTVQLSRELAKSGFEVHYIYAHFFKAPKGNVQRTDTDPDNFHSTSIDINKKYDKYNLFKRRSIEKIYGRLLSEKIKYIKPDLVISADTPLDSQKIVFKVCRKNGIEYILWLQDIYSIAINKVLKKKLPVAGIIIGMYYKHVEKQILKYCKHIIVITEDFLPILIKWGINRNKISVISNWASIEDIPIVPKNNEWAKKHGLNDKFCFLYSGSLGFKHNPAILLKLAIHFKYNNKIRVVIISEGKTVDWIKQGAKDNELSNIVFLDFQPYEQMPMVLASANVLMAILDKDAGSYSVPSKVLMFLCAGKPLLLSVPEKNLAAKIVDDNFTGFTADPEDDDRFLQYADRLFGNDDENRIISDNARAYAEKYFNIKRISGEFIKVIGI